MNKLLPTLLLLTVCFYGRAQWVSIPDTNFGTWLNVSGYSSCLQGNNTIGWQMDTTCSTVIAATNVFCSHAGIGDLTGIQYFDNLENLDCSSNLLSSFPPLPQSLRWLEFSENAFTVFPVIPNELSYLSFGYNQISDIPTLPDSLFHFNCSANLLDTLPALPSGLYALQCCRNFLSFLPPLPASLYELICCSNQITVLPSLPNSLGYLDCTINMLDSLPTLPTTLTDLYCSSNLLYNLPVLPASIQILNFSGNFISHINSFPSALLQLSCGHNQLDSLPSLPSGLVYLSCETNNLTSLPALPANLYSLEAYTNHLTSLPPLPANLMGLGVSDNQLTSIPELPDSLYQLLVGNNPISCLPRLNKIGVLHFDNTNITCLPNYPQSNSVSYPALNSVPLCGIYNTNSCPAYWNISGKIYVDNNSNCISDTTEPNRANLPVQLDSAGVLNQKVWSNVGGSYSFNTAYSNYTTSIDTAGLPFYVTCPVNNNYASVITLANPLDSLNDFGLECKPGFDLGIKSIVDFDLFRPARYTQLAIGAGDISKFYGGNCAAGVSGTVQLILSGPVSYISSAALAPTSVNGDTITWNVADFGAVNFFTTFAVTVETDTTAALGASVCATITIEPSLGDYNTANNTLTECWTVVSSYDPNIKEVYPAANIDTAQKELTYTIHFQNTGTAEAENIYVDDTLDTDLDASTFQLLAYSHQPLVQLKGNTVRFNFPNINLPDSNTNEPLSHGYVQYKIKLKDNLPIGTTINNTAYIYFDFNAPVVTNTTTNTIATNTGIQTISNQQSTFRIYPNPASNRVNVVVDETLIGSTLTLTDITGRQLANVILNTANRELSTDGLSNGVYFATIRKDGGVYSKKLMIQR